MILKVSEKQNRLILSVFLWALCAGLLVCFFISVHPFVVFDSDDWTYISGGRTLWPNVNEWNPTKILPEIIMPLLGNIAAYVIYPIKKDYMDSLSISYGFGAVLSILVLLMLMLVFYRQIFGFNLLKGSVLVTLFLLTGFIMYKPQQNMMYFFFAQSVNTWFNYDFCGILNASAILLISILYFKNGKVITNPYVGCLIVLLYLCINSNLFHSIILTSYISSVALLCIANDLIKKEKLWDMIRHIWVAIVIDCMWLISMIFELNGGRANWNTNTDLDIGGTVKALFDSIGNYNPYWVLLSFSFITLGLVNAYRQKDHVIKRLYHSCLLSLLVSSVFLILVCSKVSAGYITMPQVIWSVLFYIQFLVGLSLAMILSNRVLQILVPFLFFLLLFSINNNIYQYQESNLGGYKYEVAKRVGDDIVSQVKEADDHGINEVTVYTPYYGDENNDGWPIASYGGERISATLFRHGIITRQIDVIFKRTPEKNMELVLP